jgi:hypothetical protein
LDGNCIRANAWSGRVIWFDHATGAFSSIPNEGSQRFVLGRHPPEWPLRPVVDGVGAPLTHWE